MPPKDFHTLTKGEGEGEGISANNGGGRDRDEEDFGEDALWWSLSEAI